MHVEQNNNNNNMSSPMKLLIHDPKNVKKSKVADCAKYYEFNSASWIILYC